MLQIKNTLGGGKPEGLYVWKKYKLIPAEYASNPSFTLGAPESGDYTINISNPSFDLSNIPTLGSLGVAPFGDLQGDDYKKVIDFFDGFRFDDTCYIEKSVYDASRGNSLRYHNNGNTWWISGFYKSKSSYGFYVYQATANGVSATLTYTGEKELVPARTGDFIDYIVSDKETAYPDGGEKGGYWYEKVGGGLTPEMFGCTKMAVDEITISSRTLLGVSTDGFDFNHSLGERPKFYCIVKEDLSNIANNDFIFVMGFYASAFGISNVSTGTHGGYYYDNYIYGGASSSSSISLNNIDATKIKICRYGSASNYYRYLNTGKYKIITMA